MSEPGGIKSFVSEIEAIEAEIADFNATKSDLYKAAKDHGIDVPTLRQVIAYRRKRAKLGETALDTADRRFAEYLAEADAGTLVAVARVHAHTKDSVSSPAVIRPGANAVASSGSKGASANTDQSRDAAAPRSTAVADRTPPAGRGADENPALLSTEGGNHGVAPDQVRIETTSVSDLATGDESLPLSEPVALSDASGAAPHLLDAHGLMVDDLPAFLTRAA